MKLFGIVACVAVLGIIAGGASVGVIGGDIFTGGDEEERFCNDQLCAVRLEDRCRNKATSAAVMTVALYAVDPNTTGVNYRLVIRDPKGKVVEEQKSADPIRGYGLGQAVQEATSPYSFTLHSDKGAVATFSLDPAAVCGTKK